MAIYKLSEKIGYIRGNTTFQKKDLLSSGQYIALHYGKTYKLNSIEDTFEYYVGPEFFKPNQIVKKGDTIVITTSETIPELGKTVYYNADRSGLLGGEQIKIYPLDDSVNKKYLFY